MQLPRTIAEAARQIESRKLSPVELTQHLLERVSLLDPAIRAYITVTADTALAQARAAETEIARGHYRGPLHGIPFGAKDNYETAGILTTGHSKAYADHMPGGDAAVIEKLYQSGSVLMGKLALHELAHGGPCFDLPWPPARNPWNPEHFTGGSSSGSAAALAADCALFTLGTDTGGSIRTPASLCGLVGFKPSFGLVSRYGVIPNCYSMDHCGPLTKTVEDCALVMESMTGYDPRDRSSVHAPQIDFRGALRRDLKGIRIGVVRRFWENDAPADQALAQATEAALKVLAQLGAALVEVRLPPVQAYCDVWTLIEAPETFSIQRERLATNLQSFGRVFLERTLLAALIDGADHVDARRARSRLAADTQRAWGDCDVLVTAGAGPAPRLSPRLAAWPNVNRYTPFAMTGHPAVVVPCGFNRAGLPLSIQLVGRAFHDVELLSVAHAYEQACDVAYRQPALTGNVPAAIADEPPAYDPTRYDVATLTACRNAAERAGLRLGNRELAMMCAVAPQLEEMKSRVRALATASDEPAEVYAAK